MSQDSFMAFRCKLSRKPWIRQARAIFHFCDSCKRLIHEFLPENPVAGTSFSTDAPFCCGRPMREIEPRKAGPEQSYDIFGGFNHNAVKAMWSGEAPQWILFKTYTGEMVKQLPPGRKSPVIFPLAEEDAYVYCDRPVCEKCVYCCKKSNVLYYYYGDGKLVALPLDEVKKGGIAA